MAMIGKPLSDSVAPSSFPSMHLTCNAYTCVCVCEGGREGGREGERERERERVCVCVRERERVCVCERGNVFVCM